MLKEERQQQILEQLRRDGKVLAGELSRLFTTSEDTIRRDLRELTEAGLLLRVHGGALPRSPAATPYAARTTQAPEAKAAIAHAAAALIRSGQVVILDGGTTITQVAAHLPPDLRATVITNSPTVALALAAHPLIEIVLLGGTLYKESLVTVGAATVDALRHIRADLCMLGICSLHPEVGISTPCLDESYVKQAMIASAAEVVALASAEKLGTAAPYVVGPLTELTHLVTEQTVPPDLLKPFHTRGIQVVQA